MSQALAVVPPSEPTLRELAETVDREYGLTVEAATNALSHALNVGEALLAAEAICRTPYDLECWRRDHTKLSRGTARNYMRLAEYRELVLSGLERPSIGGAMKYLAGLGVPHRGRHSGETREEALRLRSEGMPRDEVSGLLGVGVETLRFWEDPRRYAHYKEAARERNRQRAEEKEQRLEQERREKARRAARKAGVAQAKAYADAERFQDTLGQAHSEATEREAREAWARAGEHYRKMRDEIVRALGVS